MLRGAMGANQTNYENGQTVKVIQRYHFTPKHIWNDSYLESVYRIVSFYSATTGTPILANKRIITAKKKREEVFLE